MWIGLRKRRARFFAFVRNSQNLLLDNELPLRNVNGIATSSNITTVGTDSTIDFAITIDIWRDNKCGGCGILWHCGTHAIWCGNSY